ncbi:MAG: hypothetical protein AAFX99_08570 [Myxococcota bacterium]
MPDTPDHRWRQAFRHAADEARFLIALSQALEERTPALGVGRASALTGTERAFHDLINHPTMLLGYFDGFAARTQARLRLKLKLPPRGMTRSGLDLVRLAATAATLVADELDALANRPQLGLAQQGPTRPGPLRTAEVCLEHLQQLSEHLALMVDEHDLWATLRAQTDPYDGH